MNDFSMAFIIPVYNHGATLEDVITSLKKYSLPVIVVDDGNDEKNKAYIRAAAEKHSEVILVTCKKNGGKGKAMNAGIRKAYEMNFTHVFQLDADGQHEADRCGEFIELSRKNPQSIICGFPVYDETVPYKRKKAREFSNMWARIVTYDSSIKDVLCGFRIYPVEPYMYVLNHHAWINSRMGYDVDILVHLLWKNVPLVNSGVHVTYPKDGVSNFRMVRDNLHISFTFTRLCIGMIFRFPVLLVHALKRRKNNGK